MSKGSRTKAVFVAAALAVSVISCSSGLVKSFAAMNAIQQHLIQKYHDEVIVNVQNSSVLNIAFVNSGLNKEDSNQRRVRADDAARFVARNYEDIKSIEQIWIAFVDTQSKFIVLHYTRVIEAYGFDRNAVALGRGSDSEDVRAPVAKYSSGTNQTDVSITRIQLEGNMNKGIALVPHFTVEGDARQAGGAVAPPEYVVLDFASYSDRPLFSDNAPLQIDCDDHPAVKGSARLMPTPDAGTDETVAQFLQVRMSFRALYRMAHSQKVAIALGPKHFQLEPDDIGALARMTAYVRNAGAASP